MGEVDYTQEETVAAEALEDGICRGDSVPEGREFDVSPEDFRADSYKVETGCESREELGRKGEDAAVRYLKSRGYEIVKRNWYCRFGGVEVIARDPEGTLCFIEVKTSGSVEMGMPSDDESAEKQARFERVATCYMMVSDDWDDNDSVRFDAISILVTGPHRAMLRHHKGCFNY